MELELENAALRQELAALKAKHAKALDLLERAKPLIDKLVWKEERERILAKKMTIIEGLLQNWYLTKNGWTKFWSTGRVLTAVREAIYAQES